MDTKLLQAIDIKLHRIRELLDYHKLLEGK